MKKTNKYIFGFMILSSLAIFSCNTPESKVEDASQDMKEAQEDLNDAEAEVVKAASAEEWSAFKLDYEVRISDNQKLIDALKVKMKNSGSTMDKVYEESVANLEARNADLRSRIENYDTQHSDWDKFKREYSHDMDELGAALKDFGVNNKK